MHEIREVSTTARSESLPDTLQIGEFTLTVEAYSDTGKWDEVRKCFSQVSGTAWLNFECSDLSGLILDLQALDEYPHLVQDLEVVLHVLNAQTQISLDTAQRIQPGVHLGETLHLEISLRPDILQSIVQDSVALVDGLDRIRSKGQILVGFEDVVIQRTTQRATGRIVEGIATFPAKPRIPRHLQLTVAGFTLILKTLTMTPEGATADITTKLPGELVDQDTCTSATLALGTVTITPDCRLYVNAPDARFGPWIVGDSGIVIEGEGYTLDLSLTESPPAKAPAWRGLLLHAGTASGEDLIPDPANIAYLRGQYSFHNAELTSSGLDASLTLIHPHSFSTLNPLGYILTLEAGWLQMTDSRISGGEFGPGNVELPKAAVCVDVPTDLLIVNYTLLSVENNLDVVGEVDCAAGIRLSWGELTHSGAEVIVWTVEACQGFLYLPANPSASFHPDSGAGFIHLTLSSIPAFSLAQLKTQGVAGMALRNLNRLHIFSPDRPSGIANPLVMDSIHGWLRIGCQGVDGELTTVPGLPSEELGEPAHPGYVGNRPFDADLFGQDKLNLVAQYATSAVYDSTLDGKLNIPEPCKIDDLAFTQMHLTSTAHLVGGDVELPIGGVTLDYWQLQLEPTGDPTQSGVISIRTGRIVFTAAAISEPVHFAKPFRLTWGEMLANGNLGELFFDYNNYGQCFDQIPYTPQQIMLSQYVAGATDAYLATCGTVHFNFFGPRFVNVRDARHHVSTEPYLNRYVTVPKSSEAACPLTDLHLTKQWDDLTGDYLADFDFPDASMDYHVAAQRGFIGSGTTAMSFLQSDGLDAQIEIHYDAIDIRLSSLVAHDVDIGLYTRLGGMREIHGCARIEGPLLSRISMYGLLEATHATGMGILAPKAGFMAEINLTATPNSLDFSIAGDMLLQVAGSAVDLSASVHILYDFSRDSAEGEVIGRIDCNTILAGLEGEGQVTWYADPTMHYLQGRMKVYVCGWIGSGGLEGGLFLGHNVPKALAWILHTDSEHFGVSDRILPEQLTGLFGYGRLALSFNWYIFGGGIELYAGMGAFSMAPPGLSGEGWTATPALPYVIGSCGIYVHGEILGGLVSASAWADLDLLGPIPIRFEGSFGLEGCVLWVICASIEVTAGLNSDGFYLS